MTMLARSALMRHKPFIIGVTGSVGKTTTKDAVAHVLASSSTVRKSMKSFNSEIGLPLAVLGLENAWSSLPKWTMNIFRGAKVAFIDKSYPEVLVLEIGADKAGDIGRAMKWIHPFIGVLTSLPERPVHVENYNSPEEVRIEKMKLVRALPSAGIFVANIDDPRVRREAEVSPLRVVSYGFSPDATVRGSQASVAYNEAGRPMGMTMLVAVGDGKLEEGGLENGTLEMARILVRGVLGEHILSAALAAVATGHARGMKLVEASKELASWQTAPGRMRLIDGKNGSLIIDDTYNASPVAMVSALVTLGKMPAKRRIAALGDMLELGQWSEEEHRAAGALAAQVSDILVCVGPRARWYAEAALGAGMPKDSVRIFSSSVDAGLYLSELIHDGDIVLAKGSQGSGNSMIRMERAVKQMMANINDAPKLLVRQEMEWQRQYK